MREVDESNGLLQNSWVYVSNRLDDYNSLLQKPLVKVNKIPDDWPPPKNIGRSQYNTRLKWYPPKTSIKFNKIPDD